MKYKVGDELVFRIPPYGYYKLDANVKTDEGLIAKIIRIENSVYAAKVIFTPQNSITRLNTIVVITQSNQDVSWQPHKCEHNHDIYDMLEKILNDKG